MRAHYWSGVKWIEELLSWQGKLALRSCLISRHATQLQWEWTCVITWITATKEIIWCFIDLLFACSKVYFSFFSLLESPVPGVSDTVKSQLQPRVAKLKKHDSKGVQVVLKLLANWRRTLDTCNVIPGVFLHFPPSLHLPNPPSHPLSPHRNQGWVVYRNGLGSLMPGEMPDKPPWSCDTKCSIVALSKITKQIQIKRCIRLMYTVLW